MSITHFEEGSYEWVVHRIGLLEGKLQQHNDYARINNGAALIAVGHRTKMLEELQDLLRLQTRMTRRKAA